jgi:hypothetical protein
MKLMLGTFALTICGHLRTCVFLGRGHKGTEFLIPMCARLILIFAQRDRSAQGQFMRASRTLRLRLLQRAGRRLVIYTYVHII